MAKTIDSKVAFSLSIELGCTISICSLEDGVEIARGCPAHKEPSSSEPDLRVTPTLDGKALVVGLTPDGGAFLDLV